MTVGELIEMLSNVDPTHRVIVHSGKWAFREARNITPGFYNRQAENFDPDEEGEGGTDALLIES